MNDVNIRRFTSGKCIINGQHKKHLKKFINKTLPRVEFVPALHKNESERLCTREIMAVAVDELADKFTDEENLKIITQAAAIIRREI